MTTDALSWTPVDIDTTRPSAARVYDYYLGGGCNFQVDREFAKQVLEGLPEARDYARLNRGFLQRAVRYCAQRGIRQFLDLGAGIPSAGPTHEIATRIAPDCRVVYVDNEAVAVALNRLLLEYNDQATVMQADLRDPMSVLEAEGTKRLIDFSQPVAVMMLALLHFVPDSDDPGALVASYRDAMADGSYLLLSHGTDEGKIGSRTRKAADKYMRTSNPGYLRDRTQVAALFDGFELVEPGIVFTPEWRSEAQEDVGDNPERSVALAGVGRKLG